MESDQLSLAIGKDGQNVRLASKLCNWDIDVSKTDAAEEIEGEEVDIDKEEEKTDKKTKSETKSSDKKEKEVKTKKEDKKTKKDSKKEKSKEKDK